MSKPTIRKAIERKSANRDAISLKSMKLTDLQRIVLSGAAERADGAAALPERMTAKAAQKLAATLIEQGFAREVRAKTDMPVWRRNEDGRPDALIISKLGREAIKMTGQGAPRALSRDLIARMIAHRIQEQRVGKLG